MEIWTIDQMEALSIRELEALEVEVEQAIEDMIESGNYDGNLVAMSESLGGVLESKLMDAELLR